MSEIMSLKDHGDFVEWFLLHAVIELGDDYHKIKPRPEGGLEVSLTVNGVEVPFAKTMKYIGDKREEHIQAEARKIAAEIVQEQFGQIIEVAHDAAQDLKYKLQTAGLLKEDDR